MRRSFKWWAIARSAKMVSDISFLSCKTFYYKFDCCCAWEPWRVCLDLWPHECEHHCFLCFISCMKFSSVPFESSLIMKHAIRAWFSERGDWNSSTWSGRVISIFIVGRKLYKDLGVCDQKKNRKQISFKFIGMEILEE